MSIKTKFYVSSIIMLVLPVLIMALITAFILIIGFSYLPDITIRVNGMVPTFTNPVLRRYVLMWIIVLIVAVVGCCVGITAYLSRSIILPMRKMSEAMENIARGDLDYEFTCSDAKEIKEVYDALDTLRISLKNSVSESIEKEKQYRMLIANISHDLKTPITSIKGYVEGLKDGVANTPEKEQKYLDTILLKAELLERLAGNLSVYSKLDFESEPYDIRPGDLCAFVNEILGEYTIDLKNAGIELETDGLLENNQKLLVCFDADKMRRVLVNVLGNAIKYKNPDKSGKLKVTLVHEESGALLSFADNGIGISEEEEKKVFETFYRADPARNLEGNGLGLSIADRIVRDHGGKIWMRANPSGGVTVNIALKYNA